MDRLEFRRRVEEAILDATISIEHERGQSFDGMLDRIMIAHDEAVEAALADHSDDDDNNDDDAEDSK